MGLWNKLLFSFVCLLTAEAVSFAKIPSQKTLDIGLIFRMSDKFNDTIFGTLKGIDTAKTLFEKKHSKVQVRFHRFYHGDSLESVAEAAQKAVQADLKVVIGGGISEEALVIREVFKGRKIVLVTPTSSNPAVTEGDPFIFRFCPSDKRVASDIAKLMSEKLRPNSLGVVRNLSSVYASFLVNEFQAVFKALELRTRQAPSIFEETILGDALNYENTVKKFIKNGVTHVYFPAHPSEFLNFVNQAEKKGFFPVYIGSDGWGSNSHIYNSIVKKSLHGERFVAYRTSFWNDDIKTELGRTFENLFLSMYQSRPNDWSAVAFDASWTLMNAMLNAPNLKNGDHIRNALEEIHDLQLVSHQKFSFRADRSPSGGIYLYKIDRTGVHLEKRL